MVIDSQLFLRCVLVTSYGFFGKYIAFIRPRSYMIDEFLRGAVLFGNTNLVASFLKAVRVACY